MFGARGTGKSTLIQQQILPELNQNYLYYDLLNSKEEDRFSRNPERLLQEIEAQNPEWVVIDEIQKVPKLLNAIHIAIEKKQVRFLMSGSSARKLKLQSANLLAGRAFDLRLFPFTHIELEQKFDLEKALNYGTLPKTFHLKDEFELQEYLRSYALNYVKEEIQLEQLLRKLDPFREYLEIAAQMNGQIVNIHRIAKEVGVSDKTVSSYYQILEDTYLGFYLPAFHNSVRKSQKLSPKFYFFDTGVKKALEHTLKFSLAPGTAAYGMAFEHFVICEFFRLNRLCRSDFRLSFIQTTTGGEVDLVLSRPQTKKILIEIKSSKKIDEIEVRKLKAFKDSIKNSEAFYLSQDTHSYKVDGVHCLPWKEGLAKIFDLQI